MNHSSVSNWYFVSCFFVTIASVLGTGILGLPVKTHGGFWPFCIVFVIVLFMEELVLIFAVELLQRARSQLSNGASSFFDVRNPNFSSQSSSDDDEQYAVVSDRSPRIRHSKSKEENASSSESSRLLDTSQFSTTNINPISNQDLNLHIIGKLFLPSSARVIFDACVYVHFLSVLVSYILAASESWGGVFGIDVSCEKPPSDKEQNQLRVVITIFGIIFTSAIVFGQRLFTSVVSTFTAVKGCLLMLLVGVVAFVAYDINLTISNDFSLIMESFLMSTVALGGAVNLMPLLFIRVPSTRSAVQKYRLAITSGLAVCGLVIVLWTFFIMKVVPQKSTGDDGGPSLQGAAEHGCIATVPLSEVLEQRKDNLSWIATLVQGFIIVSVTVSYITVGSGLKNFLDGYVVAISTWISKRKRAFGDIREIWIQYVVKAILYIVSFGFSLGLALGKPSCFLVILEYVTSMGLNLENGAFISIMILIAHRYSNSNTTIPLPLPDFLVTKGAIFVSLFFLAAVVYTIVSFFVKIGKGEHLC